MNLGEIHQEVRASLARGATLDAEIPTKVAQAVRWIERNYSLKYMEKFGQFTIGAGDYPATIELPNPRIKSALFLRQVLAYHQYNYLTKENPREAIGPQRSDPARGCRIYPHNYWQVGYASLQMDADPQIGDVFQCMWYEYTDWPTASDSITWLGDNAPELIVAQALYFFAPRLRDPRMMQLYQTQRDESLRTLILADAEANEADSSSAMQYR